MPSTGEEPERVREEREWAIWGLADQACGGEFGGSGL